MSLIGIDFGNDSCYIAVSKAGQIETIANEYSLHGTPSCVAFSQKNRVLGVAAKNQIVTNVKNTVFGFKRLLGRKFSDPIVKKEMKNLPFKVESKSDGGKIVIRVRYLGVENVYSPEQITAMLFTKLKECDLLETSKPSCVISVPSYFTNAERRALLDAASIAGLNVLRLLNDTTATALAYGSRNDLPGPNDKPRNVVFVDFGHSSLQVAACAFNKGKLRVLATSADPECGGRDIDMALADHFCQEFITKLKLDARKNEKAYIRLVQESEKLKKQMSSNSTRLSLNIECFMDDRDVSSEIQRSQMEKICANIFCQVERTLVLLNAKLNSEDIHSVEIVGGSTRIPAVKALIEKVFGKPPSTTLNQDEAVSRGCALQCALLAKDTQVGEFEVIDLQPYPVRLAWDKPDGTEELCPALHAAPFWRTLTFEREGPFTISAYYSKQVPYPDTFIGDWYVEDIPSARGRPQEVKLKAGVNVHGIITVENDDQENNKQHNKNKKQWKIKGPKWFSPEDLEKCIDVEKALQAVDQREKARGVARNELEEYIYKTRGNTAGAASSLARALHLTEKWLYEDGKDQELKMYVDVLEMLRHRPGFVEDYLTRVLGATLGGATDAKSEGGKTPGTAYTKSVGRKIPFGFYYEPRDMHGDEPSSKRFKGGFNKSQTSTSNENNSNHKDFIFYCEMKELNKTALAWMSKHIEQDPSCNLSPVFPDYERYVKEIKSRWESK